ncbi:MAG: hypothetical protein QM680_11755 [Luteolibacter sp.]
MRFLAFIFAFITTAHAQIAALKSENIHASITVPANWELGTLENQPVLIPKGTDAQKSPRLHIHFFISRHQSGTLEDAMNAEINGITEKNPDSSNAKAYFLGAIPLKTRSGIDGILARFAYPQEPGKGRLFTNQKFYFKDTSGKIVTVCMHVWSNETAAAQYQQFLIENLITGN